ncbi:hypothetical protein QC823_09950 [Halomonas vilamensis]|uniref:Uncharacterized protein n=1 Tax=Vreelandella vilamensis TaxID=531309 RepID=A0ABU1H4S3_9GAMM|nr:hypothetical protein [Halomonas vilamensis]MDR5899310.1 hypothetical protein [Halomonas vilamensis]
MLESLPLLLLADAWPDAPLAGAVFVSGLAAAFLSLVLRGALLSESLLSLPSLPSGLLPEGRALSVFELVLLAEFEALDVGFEPALLVLELLAPVLAVLALAVLPLFLVPPAFGWLFDDAADAFCVSS